MLKLMYSLLSIWDILWLKLQKNKENKEKYVIFSAYSLLSNKWGITEKVLFCSDDGLTLKTLKLLHIGFCIQTLNLYLQNCFDNTCC